MASGKPLLCRGLGLGVYSTAQLRTKMENKNDWFNHTRTAQHAEVGANAVNHRQVLTSDFNFKLLF